MADNIFTKLWAKLMPKLQPEPEPEIIKEVTMSEPEKTPEPIVENLEEKLRAEFAQQLEAKDAELKKLTDAKVEAERVAAEYSQRFAEEERKRKLAEFTETAKGLNIPDSVTEFAETLMVFSDADTSDGKKHYEKLIAVMKAMGNAEKTAALFTEAGTAAVGNDIESKINSLVKQRMEKNSETLAIATQAVLREHPELYAEYNKSTLKSSVTDRPQTDAGVVFVN